MVINQLSQVLELEEEYKTEWERLRDEKCKVILVGAGATSEFIYNRFVKYGVKPVFWADNDSSKWGRKLCDTEIGGVEAAVSLGRNHYYYITTQLYYTRLREQLLNANVPKESIIGHDLICQFSWEENYKEYIKENKLGLQSFIDELEDDFSKQVVLNRLAFLVTRRREFVTQVRGKYQYFEDFIDYSNLDNFIDVGAFTGDTIIELEKYCGGKINCKIIAFEMDDDLYNQAQNNLIHLKDKLQLIKKACSNEDGRIRVQGTLGIMQSIAKGTYDTAGKEAYFETCKLDSAVQDIGVKGKAFIKMDIEGAEMMALEGAKCFIRKNTPILAICIYHKADDILRISSFIKECNGNYKFRVRHYSDNQTETVLYAMVD